jgi:prepilin-type N-terminal cleavage/methylation domain-containing protein
MSHEFTRLYWTGKPDVKLRGETHRAERRAFTVTELLIVIVMISVIAAASLPKINDTVRQRRLISAANGVGGDVPVAFSLAARQRRPVTITYDQTSGELRVADRASGTIYLRRPLLSTSEYNLDGVSLTPEAIQVFPNGVASAAFSVTLTNGDRKRVVTASRTGLTRVTIP